MLNTFKIRNCSYLLVGIKAYKIQRQFIPSLERSSQNVKRWRLRCKWIGDVIARIKYQFGECLSPATRD